MQSVDAAKVTEPGLLPVLVDATEHVYYFVQSIHPKICFIFI